MRKPLIVICGPARTGTSILAKCLENSGLSLGPETLRYTEYGSENRKWSRLNWSMCFVSGAQTVLQSLRYPNDIILKCDRFVPTKTKILRAEKFEQLIRDENIQVLKDPQCAFALQWWITKSPKIFKKAKYIWTDRDRMQVAKSLVELKSQKKFYKDKITIAYAMQYYDQATKHLKKTLKNVDHIHITVEQMHDNLLQVEDNLSKFLGQSISLSDIDIARFKTR